MLDTNSRLLLYQLLNKTERQLTMQASIPDWPFKSLIIADLAKLYTVLGILAIGSNSFL